MGGPHDIPLTFAVNDYDHVRDLATGEVPVEGVRLTCMHHPVEEIFFRFAHYREWDVSELSLAKYCTLRGGGDESLIAIPAFTSRSFRHSAIFVRADGPRDRPEALRGARVGVPEWTQTATVYGRGLLEHQYGVALSEVEWIQAGTNEPGRKEGVSVSLPEGVTVRPEPERTLNEMLLTGDVDAVIAAHPPAAFNDPEGLVVRMFSDSRAEEEAFHRSTGVFPIMHVVALRADVYRRHPWIALNLMTALDQAKRRSLERTLDVNAPRLPVPWAPAHAAAMAERFGPDPWPYGLEPNRVTLEWFLARAAEQGLCPAELEPEDLFAPETLERFRI